MVKVDELISYDMVIYGGWIMGNMVYGYDRIKALNLKNVVVFGVGMSVSSEEIAKKLQNRIKSRQNVFSILRVDIIQRR